MVVLYLSIMTIEDLKARFEARIRKDGFLRPEDAYTDIDFFGDVTGFEETLTLEYGIFQSNMDDFAGPFMKVFTREEFEWLVATIDWDNIDWPWE